MRLYLQLFLFAYPVAALKVTVLGGSGFVGSRCCKALVEKGVSVTSVSTSGAAPDWCAGQEWAQSVEWRKNELTRGSRESVAEAIGSPDAVVSAVGAIGFDRQGLLLGNGVANVEAARAAAAAGAKRYVYIGVASEVADARDWLPGFFAGYFDGKADAEAAIADGFEGASTFVRPSFIYGGDSFGLFPPRVSAGYGSAVEELLSFPPLEALANVLPGLLKVALRPPVSVEAVAGAAAAAAQGEVSEPVLEGVTAINAAAGAEPGKGLSEMLGALKGKVSELAAAEE